MCKRAGWEHGGLRQIEQKLRLAFLSLFLRGGIMQNMYAEELQLDPRTFNGYANHPDSKLPFALVVKTCIDHADEAPLHEALDLVRREVYQRLPEVSLAEVMDALNEAESAEQAVRRELFAALKDGRMDREEYERWNRKAAIAESARAMLQHVLYQMCQQSGRCTSLAATANGGAR